MIIERSTIYSFENFKYFMVYRTSLVAQTVKRLPTMWETRVQSLGWEDLPRKWQPTPGFLPGKAHGRRSLVGYSPRGHKESDTTEQLHVHVQFSSVTQSCRTLCNPIDSSMPGLPVHHQLLELTQTHVR